MIPDRMRLALGGLFVALSYWISGSARANPPLELVLARPDLESRVTIDYRLDCSSPFPRSIAIRGEAVLPERTTRFDLYRGNSRVEFLLAPSSAPRVALRFGANPDCTLDVLRAEAAPLAFGTDLDALVARYSPFFVVRRDQADDRETDVPIALTYNVFRPGGDRRVIQYSLYYTDEDSKRSGRDEDSQMTRYGRRLDIQWAYRVEVDARGEKVGERFQGGILRTGLGHANLRFRGEHLPGTDHPVLYDISNHNAYSDRSTFGLKDGAGYLFAGGEEVPDPRAREDLLFERPWLLEASDFELAAEGKLTEPSDGYLYVKVAGRLGGAAVLGKLELPSGEVFRSGNGRGTLDRLGEDTWDREAYTAIPIGRARVAEILADPARVLRFSFESKNGRGDRAEIGALRFFVLVRTADSFETIELSDRFRCDYPARGLPTCVAGVASDPRP